jgi:hypothetical protein
MLSSGDIVLDATTDPNSTRDLWLLRPGRPPQRLLSPGDPIRVPTASGLVTSTLSSYSLPNGGADSGGNDGWRGADGSLLVSASVATYGRVHLTQRIELPDPSRMFANGFE